MSRAVGNEALDTLAKAIGSSKIAENAADIQGIMNVTYGNEPDAAHLVEKSGSDYDSPALIEINQQISDLQTPEKTSGLMFNPETGKLYIPCGNGITVNKATGMLEVPIGEHLRYTGSGLDVPNADETTACVVKLTHEVSNRDGEWAITADGVYAYAPSKKTTPVVPVPSGVNVPVSPSDTSSFISYQKSGAIIEKDGIYYTATTVRIRCERNDWSTQPLVFNPKLSLSCLVQVDGGFVDTCLVTEGVPSWPRDAKYHNCNYIIPAYSAFAI